MLTLRELAQRLNVSYSTARTLVLSGKLRGYKVGRLIRVKTEDFDDYLSGRVIDRREEVVPRLLHGTKLKYIHY